MTAIPKGLVVLLVDDDQQDTFIIKSALTSLEPSIHVIGLPEVEEAIAYLSGENPYADRKTYPWPDVLLVDHWMPKMSGLDLLTWMSTDRRLAAMPVVLVSGGLPPAQKQVAEGLGAVFCDKGLGTDDFANELVEALARAVAQPRHTSAHHNKAPKSS